MINIQGGFDFRVACQSLGYFYSFWNAYKKETGLLDTARNIEFKKRRQRPVLQEYFEMFGSSSKTMQ